MKKLLKLILGLAMFLPFIVNGQQKFHYPFQNYNLQFDQRIDKLLKRLTLALKMSQMLNSLPEIPRLGINAYDLRNLRLQAIGSGS